MKSCRECVNCDSTRGFMVNCHVSYDEVRNGESWHVQVGQYVHEKTANRCDHYATEKYDRDKFFVM